MPITINDADNVATVTEGTSVVSRLMDGMIGAVTGDNLTAAEAFWAAAGYGVTGIVVGSKMARKNVASGKPAFLGLIG